MGLGEMGLGEMGLGEMGQNRPKLGEIRDVRLRQAYKLINL